VDALLDLATAQSLSDPEIPEGLADPFTWVRADVLGYVADILHAQNAKAAIPTLRQEDCDRPEHFREAHRWPDGSKVARLRANLDAMRLGRDMLDARTIYLAQTLEHLLRWSRNRKAAGVRKAIMAMSTRRADTGPLPSVTHFSPFDYPKR
jgi:hypothetical protein